MRPANCTTYHGVPTSSGRHALSAWSCGRGGMWPCAQRPLGGGWTRRMAPRHGRAATGSTQGPSNDGGDSGAYGGLQIVEQGEYSVRARVLEQQGLLQAVQQLVAAGPEQAAELLRLGAVYTGYEVKGQGHIRWVRSLDVATDPLTHVVPAGEYVRVHPSPKRFPACYVEGWRDRVVHLDEQYLVVNKPAGLPCMRHESNAAEEVAACAAKALGLPGLEVCHRLDQWTTGVLVLSRDKQANKVFKQALEQREGVTKTYKALTTSPVPTGELLHYMYDGPFNEGAPVLGGGNLPPRGPRLLSLTAHPGWRVCHLAVRQCQVHDGALEGYQRHFPCAAGAAAPAAIYESTIELFTGRTHQIRAQLAAVGCPLIGDSMYSRIPGLLVGETGRLEGASVVRMVENLPSLTGRIGLHAWRLTWRGHAWQAEAPWAAAPAQAAAT